MGRTASVNLALILAMTLGMACSDDDTNNNPAADGGVSQKDGGGNADGAGGDMKAAASTLTVMVKTVASRSDYSKTATGSGVTVLATLPDGKKEEKKTGSDGKVVFDKVDWSKGTASFTAYLAGHSLTSMTGLTAKESSRTVYLVKLPAAKAVTVSGKAVNMSSAHPLLLVTSSTPNASLTHATTSQVSLKVPAGESFNLVGLNYKTNHKPTDRNSDFGIKGWTSVSSSALTKDGSAADLDFSKPLTPTKFKGTVMLPPSTASLLYSGSRAWVRVTSMDSALTQMVGMGFKTTLSAGKSFAFEGEYVKPAGVKKFVTQYTLNVGGGISSAVNVVGEPKDGFTADKLLDVPSLITPSSATTPARIWSTVEWSASEKTAVPGISINNSEGAFWLVSAPPGTAKIELPDAPAAADLNKIFGAGTLDASVGLCAERDPKTYMCGRYASGLSFKMATSGTITGEIRDRKTLQGKGMNGFSVCVDGKTTPACVKTSDGLFTLAGVSYLADGMLKVSKTGYRPLYVMMGRKQVSSAFAAWVMTEAELKAEATLAKVTPKKGTGNLGIFVIGPSGGLKDAKVALAKKVGDGPMYYGDNIKPDPSKTSTAKHGHLVWFNIPAGDHELIVTPPSGGVVCKPEFARSSTGNNRFKVTINADADTYTQVICK